MIMSNKNKTIDEIQNQNNQSMLKFWQGTEDESSKQNVIAHEDYLCFINGVGIKIGNKLIIKNNKKIDVTPDAPTIDPSALKFGDRIDNKATVVGTYDSNDGKTYVYAILDAQYRGANIAWSTNLGINRIDTGLPNYSSVPAEQNKESATYNTNYILNDYSAVEAFTFCRNIESLRFNDKQYSCQLPNCYELQQIYNKKSELDALDPTATTNSTKKLSNWGFGSQYALVWSSNERDSERSWLIDSSGLGKYSNKNNDTYGVCPIIEIPISNNTPSEETSKEFTITSNASNATILVNEVQ